MVKISLLRRMLTWLVCVFAIYVSLPTFINVEGGLEKFFLPNRMALGLDLRGGSSMLLEVDEASYIKEQIRLSAAQVQKTLAISGLKVGDPHITEHGFSIKDVSQDQFVPIESAIASTLGYSAKTSYQDYTVDVEYQPTALREMGNELMNQTLKIIARRIDESGTKEIDLQRQGENYISLQVPGVYDPAHLKSLLGKTAKLTFNLVDDNIQSASDFTYQASKPGFKILPIEVGEDVKSHLQVQAMPVISGDMLLDARVALNMGMPVVNFKLNDIGARIFGDFTSKHKGKRLAIVLDNKILSAPVVNEPILGGSGVISGKFNLEAAEDLAILLRAGALPAPIKIAQESMVGPTLGTDSIEAGKKAVILGIIFIVTLMMLVYKFFGLVANIAVIMNIFLMLAVMILLNATITLPSIAGIVLTLGMAVDANVLIFERIKEELRRGNSNLSAVRSGYKAAFVTILDSNVTTIIAALILYIFGYGPIRGFAVALIIGILCSMFTAITLTKIIISDWLRAYKPDKLWL